MQALKEWAVVCQALGEGRQSVLLRKGGILEFRQGFEVKHDRFLLFPTYEHQSKDSLKPEFSAQLDNPANIQPPDGKIMMALYAEAVMVREVSDRSILHRLADFHIWNETYVNARMDYNPSKPMSVILLRVFRLPNPIEVQGRPEWAGCRSWVPLEVSDVQGSRPVLGEAEFRSLARQFQEALAVAA